MSIELYFLINLLADFSVLAAAARGLGCLRIGRVGPAAALSALFGTLARAFPPLAAPSLQLILLIPLSAFVVRRTSPREVLVFGLSLCTIAIVTGTCAAYVRHAALAVAIVPPACALTTGCRRNGLAALDAHIEIVHRGRTSVLHAFIDTGNRLTEPLSGQPVLIASAYLLRDILPTDGYREVAYGSVGGAGTLRCFRPDLIYMDISGCRRRAPDTWIALFPSRLPGGIQALAPAEYALK